MILLIIMMGNDFEGVNGCRISTMFFYLVTLGLKEHGNAKHRPEDRQPYLHRLREIFVENLKRYKESMRFGGPCYEKNDVVEAEFASRTVP